MWPAGTGRTALVAYIIPNILEIIIKKNIYMNVKMKKGCALGKRTLLQVLPKILTARSPHTLFSSLFTN